MALTQLQVIDVCYGGNRWGGQANKTCKYLEGRLRSDGKYVHVCTKKNPGAFAKLEAAQKGANYYPGPPTGDNCSGYLLLEFKDQGYDI